MIPPKMVCTIEQGKIIEEMGVRVHGCFEWNTLNGVSNVHNYGVGENIMGRMEREQKEYTLVSYPAYTVSELGVMIGQGTKMAEKHWQWLLDSVNSGLSGTVAYNPVALAGFVITALQEGWATADEINERLNRHKYDTFI